MMRSDGSLLYGEVASTVDVFVLENLAAIVSSRVEFSILKMNFFIYRIFE